jgi:hypothetical protein
MVVPGYTGGVLEGPGTVKVEAAWGVESKDVGVQSTVPQVTFQFKPEFEGSPVTAAATVIGPGEELLPASIRVICAPEGMDDGGGCVMVTAETVDRIVTMAAELLL